MEYYNKLKELTIITKRLFNEDLICCCILKIKLKNRIEEIIKKPIKKITNEDIIKYKIGWMYAKYKTIEELFEIFKINKILKSIIKEL